VEHRNPRHAGEVYTITQVEGLTSVPANTIRSWERRYGFPHPSRSRSNYRTYTQDDVDAILRVKAERERGRTVEQAIASVSAIDEATTIERAAITTAHPNHHEAFGNALLAGDLVLANKLLADATWASSMVDTCYSLLVPAAETLIRGEAAAGATAVHARNGRAWLHRRLMAALDASEPEVGRHGIVAATIHDPAPSVLALSHAVNLSQAGFKVTWIGAGIRIGDLRAAVDVLQPAASLLDGTSRDATIAIAAFTEQWQGQVLIATEPPLGHPAAIDLPPNAVKAREAVDDALRQNEGPRLVRNA